MLLLPLLTHRSDCYLPFQTSSCIPVLQRQHSRALLYSGHMLKARSNSLIMLIWMFQISGWFLKSELSRQTQMVKTLHIIIKCLHLILNKCIWILWNCLSNCILLPWPHIFQQYSPPSAFGLSCGITGLPASAQYAHVILNSPHTPPLQPRDRLQLDAASQIQPKHSSLTGPCSCSETFLLLLHSKTSFLLGNCNLCEQHPNYNWKDTKIFSFLILCVNLKNCFPKTALRTIILFSCHCMM